MPEKYEPPTAGSIIPLRSKFSKDPMTNLIGDLNSLLENKGLLDRNAIVPLVDHQYTVYLGDYIDKTPLRLHEEYWIDGGEQIAVINPETNIPFFFNCFGSKICRACDGEHSVRRILKVFETENPTVPDKELHTDIMKFLLLLEEIDLISF